MTLCLDIHTHHAAPQPQGVVSVSFKDFDPIENQFYSVGIHPWTTSSILPTKEEWEEFERIASLPCVVAIGECGIDKIKGGPLFKQLIILNKQIELSEKLGKPLIIHDVKAHDVIVGLKRDLKPLQKWAIHGFRGKPSVAKMMSDAGIYLSFGEKFNPETPVTLPDNFILAETDESPLTIEEIIANLSTNLGRDVTSLIAANTISFLDIKTITPAFKP
ncbi:MAG: TatD family hydrolase [Muribaculaceae bacterium]|nr:TatD family hydrolase [Muribaculaceae bacterium]